MSDVIFGLATYKGAIAGLQLQNISEQETGQQNEPLNEDGAVNQIDLYANKKVLSATGNVIQGGNVSAIKRGGTLTVNGTVYKITNVTWAEGASANKTCQLTGEAPVAPPSGSGS